MAYAPAILSRALEAFIEGTRAYAEQCGTDPGEVVNSQLVLTRALCEAMQYAIEQDAEGNVEEVRAAIGWARTHVQHLQSEMTPEQQQFVRCVVAAAHALEDDDAGEG